MSNKSKPDNELAPLWSTPEPGKAKSWLRRELKNAAYAFVGIGVLGAFLIGSALLKTVWPMVVVGGAGTLGLLQYRQKGGILHALWVASLFLFLGALACLPFCFIRIR